MDQGAAVSACTAKAAAVVVLLAQAVVAIVVPAQAAVVAVQMVQEHNAAIVDVIMRKAIFGFPHSNYN